MRTVDVPSTQIAESTEKLWGLPLHPHGCPQCKRTFLCELSGSGQACPICRIGLIQPQPALLRSEPPEKIISPKVNRADFVSILNSFVKDIWLRSPGFSVDNLVRNSVLIHWPMWMVDAQVDGQWQAEVGFDYQVKSSQEAYRNGGWQTREVIETRVRWEPRLGQITRCYENVSAPALEEHAQLVENTGSYPLHQAVPYQPDQFPGAILWLPDLAPENAWSSARGFLDRIVADDCRQAAGAQHLRNFGLSADYQSVHWTLLLLPLYVSFYTDDKGKPYPVFINAQTGAVGGVRIASQRKGWQFAGIAAFIAFLLFIFSILCFSLGAALPVVSLMGVLFALLSIAAGIFAVTAVVWPWQWNRRQHPLKVARSDPKFS